MAEKLTKPTIKKIKKIYQGAIKNFAEEMSSQIESAYEDTISLFYADYGPNNGDPWFYDRTYSTYLASNGHDNPYSSINVQQFGDSFFAGIGVSSSNIPGNPYKIYKEWVFNRTFYEGIHGIARKDVIKRNELIRQRYQRQRKFAKLMKAKRKTLKIEISMTGLIRRIPKTMSPSPKKIMDDQFKKLTKKKNMDRIFNEVLDKTLR